MGASCPAKIFSTKRERNVFGKSYNKLTELLSIANLSVNFVPRLGRLNT
jgi:hypothetical protein